MTNEVSLFAGISPLSISANKKDLSVHKNYYYDGNMCENI
jgi:hypothetical protein